MHGIEEGRGTGVVGAGWHWWSVKRRFGHTSKALVMS
jgi:hypothetical protein